jgi:hypothetical protein
MNHDELIAASTWSGEILTLRFRMAEYSIDGARFGLMELDTKSGSPNDVYMQKRVSEIVTAAMVLSRLGYQRVRLFSLDENGKLLESPDLDCQLPSGHYIGIEIAEVVETAAAKHNASRNEVEVTMGDLIDKDPTFATAFGNFYFDLTLNGIGPHSPVRIGSKKEKRENAHEVEALIRSGCHQTPFEGYYRPFPDAYKTLHARGAQFHASPMDSGPYFSMSEGAGTIGRVQHLDDVVRVLDKHRRQAANYRQLPTWIVLFLTDPFELFYNTIQAAVQAQPPVAPFERAYLMDVSRLVELRPPANRKMSAVALEAEATDRRCDCKRKDCISVGHRDEAHCVISAPPGAHDTPPGWWLTRTDTICPDCARQWDARLDKETRDATLRRANGRCEQCGKSFVDLQIVVVKYTEPQHPQGLQVTCRSCLFGDGDIVEA